MPDNDAKAPASLRDLIVPLLPSMITSLVLNAITDLSGGAKLALATVLGVVLWWLLRPRSAGSRQAPAGELARRYWRWGIVALGAVAILALVVTVLVFDRPSATTAGLGVASLVVVGGIAFRDRRVPGAIAAGISGAIVGLCVGIALTG